MRTSAALSVALGVTVALAPARAGADERCRPTFTPLDGAEPPPCPRPEARADLPSLPRPLTPPALRVEERAVRPSALVTGVLQEGRDAGEGARTVGRVFLAPFREAVNLIFLAARVATNVVEQEQIVPRINAFTSRREGDLAVFPTLFFDPNRKPSGGLRMIAGARNLTTDVRGGTGGPNEFVAEAKLRVAGVVLVPVAFGLEALFDMRTDLQFVGLGQDPKHDPRNQFRTPAVREARYREVRSRAIASLGVRPTNDIEILLGTSFLRRHVDDAPDSHELALSRVFEPGSVPGGLTRAGSHGETTLTYTELAVRVDTRSERAIPVSGAFAEAYSGLGIGVLGDPTQYARIGFRLAAFFSILKKHNILSPKLVVEQVAPFGDAPVPFTELARQPEYRGLNNRRDNLALTGSLDYRWRFAPQVSGRLFVDLTTVGKELGQIGAPRVAGGFGFDLHDRSDVAQTALAFSEDGVSFFLSFGVPSSFGDRLHRD